MSSSRDALLCMAGSASRGTNRPNSALGSNVVKGPFVGASEQGEGSDTLDIRVSRSGGWWLPFFLGIGTGAAGAVAFYRWRCPPAPSQD